MHLQQHFPYFLWYFSFLIFYILRTLIHKNQNIIWSFASFHAQIRYISGISCPMSTDHLQNNIWLFVSDQNMTLKFLCTNYCIWWIKQECKRISRDACSSINILTRFQTLKMIRILSFLCTYQVISLTLSSSSIKKPFSK